VESITGAFIKAECTRAASICKTSAVTDHISNENHVTDWENVKVVDRESDKPVKHIREAVWIRKIRHMNRDDGSYQLSHVWYKLLTLEAGSPS